GRRGAVTALAFGACSGAPAMASARARGARISPARRPLTPVRPAPWVRLMTMTQPDRRFLGHPRGLAYIVFTEAWERFSFYGMQALLMLYMVNRLLKPGNVEKVSGFATFRAGLEGVFGSLSTQALASQMFGLYVALVYILPIFGGLVGDRLLGKRRAVTL